MIGSGVTPISIGGREPLAGTAVGPRGAGQRNQALAEGRAQEPSPVWIRGERPHALVAVRRVDQGLLNGDDQDRCLLSSPFAEPPPRSVSSPSRLPPQVSL